MCRIRKFDWHDCRTIQHYRRVHNCVPAGGKACGYFNWSKLFHQRIINWIDHLSALNIVDITLLVQLLHKLCFTELCAARWENNVFHCFVIFFREFNSQRAAFSKWTVCVRCEFRQLIELWSRYVLIYCVSPNTGRTFSCLFCNAHCPSIRIVAFSMALTLHLWVLCTRCKLSRQRCLQLDTKSSGGQYYCFVGEQFKFPLLHRKLCVYTLTWSDKCFFVYAIIEDGRKTEERTEKRKRRRTQLRSRHTIQKTHTIQIWLSLHMNLLFSWFCCFSCLVRTFLALRSNSDNDDVVWNVFIPRDFLKYQGNKSPNTAEAAYFDDLFTLQTIPCGEFCASKCPSSTFVLRLITTLLWLQFAVHCVLFYLMVIFSVFFEYSLFILFAVDCGTKMC